MAKGENAQRWGNIREYWSRRHPGMLNWGWYGKLRTHRKERQEAKKIEREAVKEIQKD